jgi:hypothetical protein
MTADIYACNRLCRRDGKVAERLQVILHELSLHSHTIDFALSTLVVAWPHFGNIPMAVKNVACCGL